MEKSVSIKCLNTSTVHEINRGTSLLEIAESLDIQLKNRILGAMVNNELEELDYEVYQPKKIQFIDITHPDGMRMYTRSLCFLLYKAVSDLYPNARLIIGHSVSNGIYCKITGKDFVVTEEIVDSLAERMHSYVNKDLAFVRVIEETADVIKKVEEHGLHDKVSLLKLRGLNYKSYYKLDGAINFFYGYLLPSASYVNSFDLIKYFDGLLLRLPMRSDPGKLGEIKVEDQIVSIFKEYSQWNSILQVSNIGELNEYTTRGSSEKLIKLSEALHEKKIAQIADMICSKKEEVKIILISGPSSSGKTTFAKRLAIQMRINGIKPLNISLDDYFVDRELTPRDESGDYDFEALEAIDLELFNRHLTDLVNGEKVTLPKFSFEKGTRSFNGETIQMGSDNMLIIEGIHGLNPQLTATIARESKFMVFVSALTALNLDNHNWVSARDNRLIRRLVRDYLYRKYSGKETIARWPSVMKGEEKHIVPFRDKADIMFNSALLYELAVLKYYVVPILMEIHQNQVEYAEAKRLLNFLSYFITIKPEEIPPTSIIREFLGGSSFNY